VTANVDHGLLEANYTNNTAVSIRDVADVDDSIEREKMVFAHRIERNVF
jgi:hypothetical protein